MLHLERRSSVTSYVSRVSSVLLSWLPLLTLKRTCNVGLALGAYGLLSLGIPDYFITSSLASLVALHPILIAGYVHGILLDLPG